MLGHIAESVAELLLADLGYISVWDQVGEGAHGVDLLMLSPSLERLVAVEVKGTLAPKRVPRLSDRFPGQMSPSWLDDLRNAGMVEWDVSSADVYGMVAGLNLADLRWRAAVTDDFQTYTAVQGLTLLDV